uniref:Uncharacterized protein n=1 Tax=Apteryx owenii TaxID=8824 RepID=A0A8B9P731_APTOW
NIFRVLSNADSALNNVYKWSLVTWLVVKSSAPETNVSCHIFSSFLHAETGQKTPQTTPPPKFINSFLQNDVSMKAIMQGIKICKLKIKDNSYFLKHWAKLKAEKSYI